MPRYVILGKYTEQGIKDVKNVRSRVEATQREAQQSVKDAMYPEGEGPRNFRNRTQFIVGRARA